MLLLSRRDEDSPYQQNALLLLVIHVYTDTANKNLEKVCFKSTLLVSLTHLGAGYQLKYPEPTAFSFQSCPLNTHLLTPIQTACTCMHCSFVSQYLHCLIRLFLHGNCASGLNVLSGCIMTLQPLQATACGKSLQKQVLQAESSEVISIRHWADKHIS